MFSSPPRPLLLALLLVIPAAWAADGTWAQWNARTTAQYRSGDYDAALLSAQQALALTENDATRNGRAQFASSLNAIALIHQAQGDIAAAIPLLQRALNVSADVLPPNHPNLDALRANLDTAQAALRQHQAAQLGLQTQALNEQALAHHARGEYAEAAALYEQVLPRVEQQFGRDSVETARVLAGWADTHAARKQYAPAETLYARALTLYALHDNEVIARASAQNALAVVHYRQRHYGQARPLFEQALTQLESVRGLEHPDLLPVLDNLVALYRITGHADAAARMAARAMAIRRLSPSPNGATQ